MGADVIRIDRPGRRPQDGGKYALSRGRRSIVVDLKQPDGADTVLALAERADALIEGYRPGVAERLGIGPDECLARNPRLVYGRMTGWGNEGPLSRTAGHDLNYLSLTGALTLLQHGPDAQPVIPPGLLADFAGGGLMMAFGVVCAVFEASRSGQGQVIDSAMVDGVASLTTLIYAMAAQGRFTIDAPGSNFCDGGSHYYNSYETSDGRFLAVAASEPQFYALLVEKLGLDLDALPDRDDPANWPGLTQTFAAVFRTRPHVRMARDLRRHRRLRHARSVLRRGPGAPAQRRARHVRGGVRRRPTGARATSVTYPGRDRRATARGW